MNTFWANTKQSLKEKLGKSNDTAESPELKDRTRKLEETRKYLKDIYKGLLRETKTTTQALEEGKEVAQALSDYASRLQLNRESGKLAAALRQTGDFSAQFYEFSNTLNGHRVNEVLVPMRDLVIGEIREARYAKKRYDKVRLAYDSALNGVRNLESKATVNEVKLNEARQHCEEQRIRFREASYNTLDLIDETDDQADCVVLDILIRFMEAYHEFFKQGYEMLSEVLPAVQKHRESIEEIKSDIAKKKGNRAIQRAAEFEQNGEEKVDEKTCIFGKDLAELAERDGVDYPVFLDKCFEFVNENALDVEGIFRISGASAGVQIVINHLNKGESFDYSEYIHEPHLVVGVLKAFFRKLPAPLLTHANYHRILETSKLKDNPQERLKALQQILAELPAPNKALLSGLLSCLKNIASNESANKMGTSNLAMVIAPTILYPQMQDSAQMIADIPLATTAVEFMISHCTELNLPSPKCKTNTETKSNIKSSDDSSAHTSWSSVPTSRLKPETRSLRGAALKGSGVMLNMSNPNSDSANTISQQTSKPSSPKPSPSARPVIPATHKPNPPPATVRTGRAPVALSSFGSGRLSAVPAKPPAVPTRNLEEMQRRAAVLDKKRAFSLQVKKGPASGGNKGSEDELELECETDSRKLAGWSKAIPKVYKQQNGGSTITKEDERTNEDPPPTNEHVSADTSDSDTEDHLSTSSDSDGEGGAAKGDITIDGIGD